MLAGLNLETPKVVRWDLFCCLTIPGESSSDKVPLSLSIPLGIPTSSVKGQNENLILHCKYDDEVPNQRFNELVDGWSENNYFLYFSLKKMHLFFVKVLESLHIMFLFSYVCFVLHDQ